MFGHSYFGASYFGGSYFGPAAGAIATITDTDILQKPVNCVLAGQQPYKFSGREYEIRPMNTRSSGHINRTRVARLRGQRPSFTTTSNNRGYD